jgi:hypothetical protein
VWTKGGVTVAAVTPLDIIGIDDRHRADGTAVAATPDILGGCDIPFTRWSDLWKRWTKGRNILVGWLGVFEWHGFETPFGFQRRQRCKLQRVDFVPSYDGPTH